MSERGKWVTFRCPSCGAAHRQWVTFESESRSASEFAGLSPVALAIITKAPERFRRGKPCTIREMMALTGYSRSSVHRGYQELMARGFVAGQPHKGRGVQYVGVPSQLLSESVRSLAA